MGQLGLPGPYGRREAQKRDTGHKGGRRHPYGVTVGIADAVARMAGNLSASLRGLYCAPLALRVP